MPDDYYKKVFSKNLNYYMKEKGVTQIDIINDLGINKSAISTWCNGTRLPREDKIDLLAKYFNITRSDLMEEGGAQQNKRSKSEERILKIYNDLNNTGKDKVVDYAKDLSQNPSYAAKSSSLSETPDPYKIHTLAAHERPGATEEDKQKDYDMMNDPDIWGDI